MVVFGICISLVGLGLVAIKVEEEELLDEEAEEIVTEDIVEELCNYDIVIKTNLFRDYKKVRYMPEC